MQHIAGFLVYK